MPDISRYMELLSWVLPPIVGAVIGYITNDIAIKMLFRPLRPYHIGKLRVPFTPGIIPRQREKLADSIGVMVSRELITEDAIRRQISTPSFQKTLSARISDLSSSVLYTPVKQLPEKFRAGNLPVRQNDRPEVEKLPADTQLLQDILTAFFRSDAFFNGLDQSLVLAMRSFLQLRLRELSGGDGTRLFDLVGGNIHLDTLREPVKKITAELVIEGIRNNVSLDKFLSPAAIDGIMQALNRLYPAIARELLTFLNTPHIHATLERRGRTVLRKLISRMNSLQRLFIVAGQYDRNLEKQMEDIVDDVLSQLELAAADDDTREKILETVRNWLRQLSTHTLVDVVNIWGKTLPEDIQAGIDAVFNIMKGPQVENWLRSLLVRGVQKYGESTIGVLLGSLTGRDPETVCSVLSGWIVRLIRTVETGSQTTLQFFSRLLSALSENGHRNAFEILHLEPSHKLRIDAVLNRFVMGVLNTQVPAILESVDVHTLVVDRINSLDIEKVEELILIVIRTHLRWIILFGALLGFSIGAVQVLLMKLL